jgi:hypothetical protein
VAKLEVRALDGRQLSVDDVAMIKVREEDL